MRSKEKKENTISAFSAPLREMAVCFYKEFHAESQRTQSNTTPRLCG